MKSPDMIESLMLCAATTFAELMQTYRLFEGNSLDDGLIDVELVGSFQETVFMVLPSGLHLRLDPRPLHVLYGFDRHSEASRDWSMIRHIGLVSFVM